MCQRMAIVGSLVIVVDRGSLIVVIVVVVVIVVDRGDRGSRGERMVCAKG